MKIAEEAPHDEQLPWGVAGHLAIAEYYLGRPEKAKELCLTHVKEALNWVDRLGMKPDYAEALPLLKRLERN